MREKMKLKDILSPSFKDYQKAIEPMIAVGWDSDLCQKVVSNGWLSEEQMRRSAAASAPSGWDWQHSPLA